MTNWMSRLREPVTADSLLSFDPAGSGGYALVHILERRLAGRGRGGYQTRNAPDIREFREIWAIIAYICDARYFWSKIIFKNFILRCPLCNFLHLLKNFYFL